MPTSHAERLDEIRTQSDLRIRTSARQCREMDDHVLKSRRALLRSYELLARTGEARHAR